jgi:hypothetical protein
VPSLFAHRSVAFLSLASTSPILDLQSLICILQLPVIVYNGIAGAPDCRYIIHENRKEIHEINRLLGCCAPPVCGIDPPPPPPPTPRPAGVNQTNTSHPPHECSFFDIPSVWSGAFYEPWKDPLSSAQYFTEFLMLQALNGMPLPRGIPFHKVKELSRLHEAHMDLITNDVNSANFGATLLAHMTASMAQRASGKNITLPANVNGPTLAPGPQNRFLFYAGHDINILYLRNLLRYGSANITVIRLVGLRQILTPWVS